ncbi:electron transport complex subunit RsxC [Colwellia sp. MSW7]|uniref:Ion-translocating oxidoreductase complex subunit C n=1 Tax=Colwellia maritima TaxID=2912588 RepID=A0ABS9X4Y5_9GAMM|nr:electron transport complex subunit RsxC [Colwellia maritima]MCI2285310.1 electron transport complex subunit RsxC [Colwellia maritima]
MQVWAELGFPTHIKVNTKPDINFLIINAAECEPYITSDDLLMREQSEAIIDGIKILDHLLNPGFILIGIENNKPIAIKALQQATKDIEKIKVCVIPTKYPSGGEKQLIKILTGKEVKSGSLPIHSGIVVQNVATCFAISDAVIHDTPLIRRVVTLTGQALSKPQNVWALLGTPVSYLLEQTGFTNERVIANNADNNVTPPVIMGGPLMGFSILNELVPIIKTSNCILAPSKTEMPSAFDNYSNEVECIRCGQCAEVCPSQLLPQEMQWSAKAKDFQQLTKLNIFDCIDCGACAYVCPSQIPLVQYYRVAKAEIRQQQQLDIKSEKAKVRFEARKLRLEKEKIAREEKHKKAAAARKATMNKKSADGSSASSAVAAALARVKAKKQADEKGNESTDANTDEKSGTSQVQAAIARAKAKKLAKHNAMVEPPVTENVPSSDDTNEKSQVKAAIARAKAKRLAKHNATEEPAVTENVPSSDNNNEKSQVQEKKSPEDHSVSNDALDKKAKIAAAIAKAKAKKEAKKEIEAPEINSDIEKPDDASPNINDKKARITQAVAKAKAKANAKKEQAKQAELLKETNNEAQSSLKLSKEESE